MASEQALPIDEVLPEIIAGLREQTRLVITAPPGAGKTTRVPLALLDEPWAADGKIVLVEPRRIAARAAAERMAAALGEKVGDTVGLRSRLDVRVSKQTRLEVITEGVFNRIILSDPGLDGIACVIFDEFHERSLDADEGMAFALDAQQVLRDELRLVVMSATLPPGLTEGYFVAPVITSDGRAHPVETRYLGYSASERLDKQVANAIRKALSAETGSVLAFLPGVAEIRRTLQNLEPVPDGVQLCPLYGALTPKEQSAAIAPAPAGMRKVVLATDIAESAITIEGVRVVVDSGFSRTPRFDPALGATRLETGRIAKANADQRRGRAGRTQAGICYRLWREAEMGGFRDAPVPEIEQSDLTGLRLDLAQWGARAPEALSWLTQPPRVSWSIATELLVGADALTHEGTLTDIGKQLQGLPLSPRIGLMMLRAAAHSSVSLAGDIAAVLSERDLGGRSSDISDRIHGLHAGKGQRERAMCELAKRWTKLVDETGAHDAVKGDTGELSPGAVLALAFPERIAHARPDAAGRYHMAGGRGAWMEDTDPMSREQWLVAADITGAGADVRITLAAAVSLSELNELGLVTQQVESHFDLAARSVRVRRTKRIGAITLESVPIKSPDAEHTRAALLDAVRTHGLSILPGADKIAGVVARVGFLADQVGAPWPSDFGAQLIDQVEEWLGPLLSSPRLDGLDEQALEAASLTLLGWSQATELAKLAPVQWRTPAGTQRRIDYQAAGGPLVECKVQEVFGLGSHPVVTGNVPLTLNLLSPAGRPVAVTKDLPSFWIGGYGDMRKDMKARYPKHDWPDDPASAVAASRSIRRKASSPHNK